MGFKTVREDICLRNKWSGAGHLCSVRGMTTKLRMSNIDWHHAVAIWRNLVHERLVLYGGKRKE